MRRIKFDEKTIEAIRTFISEGHTIKEACNRFTLKYDTMKRIMRENNISPFYKYTQNEQDCKTVSKDVEDQVCALFSSTNTRLYDICKECKLDYHQLQKILNLHFTQKQQDDRKSKLRKNFQLATKALIAQYDEDGSYTRYYKRILNDGDGYLQCLKPEWYTGRSGSTYVFYHHVVMCKALGLTEIPKGFCVHHIDGDRYNNDMSNLCMMTISAHSKLHNVQRNLCKVQRLSNDGVGSDSQTPNSSRQ